VRATAEVVGPTGPRPAGLTEEAELVLRWLEAPGVRIVDIDGLWTCPVGGAGSVRHELEPAVAAATQAIGFDRDVPGPSRGARSGLRRAG
jgi:DNA polymerase-3 subunit epsilon